jgi:hemolysin III
MFLLDFREPVSAWTHCAWLFLSVPATILLWKKAGPDRPKRVSLLIFGLSLGFCYAASTLFHGVRGDRDHIDLFDRFDHIGIYVLIAGSYTPLACGLLGGAWRWGSLLTAWVLAAAGILRCATIGVLPMMLETAAYLVMGWGALVCYLEIARTMTHRPLRPLVLGGLLYTIGAAINLLNWPDLWPGVLGPHELFHLFVMAGSLAHFWFMLTVVAPFESEPWASPFPTLRQPARRPAAAFITVLAREPASRSVASPRADR